MKWIFSVLLLVICLTLGCSQLTEDLPSDRVIVNFWHGMSGPLGDVLNTLIDEFNAQNNYYYVHGVSMGSYDTLQKKILASVVASRSPDISQNFEALTMKLSRAGKLVCLDDLIAKEANPENFRDDIIPVLYENNTYKGKLWSFPFNKSVPILYYNKDMFAARGLDPQKPPKTVDELFRYAHILTQDISGDGKTDIYGFAFTLRNQWNWACRLLSYGGRMYDVNTGVVSLNTKPSREATRSYAEMIRLGIGKFSEGYDYQKEWEAGEVAMFEASVVSRVYVEQDRQDGVFDFDYGMAPIVYGENPAVVLSGTNINIFNNGDPERIKGAWEFIKWFTSTEIGARWSLGTTYLPVRQSSIQTALMQEALAKNPDLEAPFNELEHATFDPRISEWFECRVKIADDLEQTYIKTTDIRSEFKAGDELKKLCLNLFDSISKIVSNALNQSEAVKWIEPDKMQFIHLYAELAVNKSSKSTSFLSQKEIIDHFFNNLYGELFAPFPDQPLPEKQRSEFENVITLFIDEVKEIEFQDSSYQKLNTIVKQHTEKMQETVTGILERSLEL